MGPRLIPIIVVSAILSFGVAAAAIAIVPEVPRLWSGALSLVVLSGITPLIYSVNARVVPVFSRRTWKYPRILFASMILTIGGGWLVFLSAVTRISSLGTAGHLLALIAGIGFVFSIITLFRQSQSGPAAAPPSGEAQRRVDQQGTGFTRLAGIWLLLGLATGLMLEFWRPSIGRWDLVWAHALLVGWFVSMASGILYHVLPRWTGQTWRWPRLIRIHYLIALIGLPIMVAALALDLRWLFFLAGPLQAIGIGLLIINAWPLARTMPGVSSFGLRGALVMLLIGVSIGASFAIDPVNHVTMRISHAQINLFGWAGLLISSVGYYLFPRFAGQPLAWPRLARLQIQMLLFAVVTGAPAWWWYSSIGGEAQWVVLVSGLLVAMSFFLFAAMIGETFRRAGQVVNPVVMAPRPERRSASLTISPPRSSS